MFIHILGKDGMTARSPNEQLTLLELGSTHMHTAIGPVN